MRSTVQLLNTLVLVTIATACAPRAARVVETPNLFASQSQAYDVDAHAARAVERDQRLARNVAAAKARLGAVATFNFFRAHGALVDPMYRVGWWLEPDRHVIRTELARILAWTEQRRAFQDDEQLQWDAARARAALDRFGAYDAQTQAVTRD